MDGQTAVGSAEAMLATRARQQAAVAQLGLRALAGAELSELFDAAVALLADGLGVEYAKILESLPDGTALLLRAGVGWRGGAVGCATVGAGLDSQAGYTLHEGKPVIVEDLRTERRFDGPPLLREHGVVSGLSVIIHGLEQPFGILGAHTARGRAFTEDDLNFLQAVANVLAAAVERRRAEEDLARSRDQLAIILRDVADGITVQAPDGSLVYASAAAARLIGYPSVEALLVAPLDEVTRKFEVFDEHGRPFPLSQLPGRRALLGEQPPEVVLRFRDRDDGAERWAAVKATPVVGADGQVRLAINVFSDITEQKRAEAARLQVAEERARRAAAEAAEARYRYLFERAADAVVVVGAEGSIVEVNTTATRLLGYSRDEFLQMRLGEGTLVDSGWARDEFARLERAGYWAGELEVRHKDGGLVPVEARVARVELPTGTVYRGTWRDISERRALQRLEREFTALITRELRTPLTAIRDYADLLRRASRPDGRALEAIVRQADHLNRLVGDLLESALLEAGRLPLRLTSVDLVEVADAAIDRARGFAPTRTLRLESSRQPLVGQWDRDRLDQIFDDLLGYTLQQSRSGREVFVRIEGSDGAAEVTILDRGSAMPARKLPHLFERFHQTGLATRSGSATNAPGLYVTRGLIEAHGGRIYVESKPGQGTTFCFVLPFEPPVDGRGLPGDITPRELEVMTLIAHGKTNAEIAEELVLSPGTVANYVHRILGKLGLSTRAQLAAWVVERGLRPPIDGPES